MLSMATVAFGVFQYAEVARGNFRASGLTMLPNLTVWALQLAKLHWIPSIVCAASGATIARARPDRITAWSILTILIYIAFAAFIVGGLALPYQHLSTR
jgi:hypothetical protein